MAEPIEEPADAKVNLTLRVRGRRPDGYHEIESLVVFAGCGDAVVLHPGKAFALSVDGPFAGALGGTNLIETAVRALANADSEVMTGTIRLTKNLPVAAGLGGGSADAAAALRSIRRANPHRVDIDWPALAAGVGADTPVCLLSAPAWVTGIGERVTAIPSLPGGWMLLANPGLPLPTATVFAGLSAPPVLGAQTSAPSPRLTTLADVAAFVAAQGNDLEHAAIALCPPVGEVKAALASTAGALAVCMSGSGPTCFAVYASRAEADAAAARVRRSAPGWWLAAAPFAAARAP